MGLNRRFGYAPKHRAAKMRDERSNSFAVFIVVLPVVLGAFGLGVDTSRNVYIRASLQNSLDMATVAGAGVTTVNEAGKVVIDRSRAVPTIEHIYARNRSHGPVVECPRAYPIAGSTERRCWHLASEIVTDDYIEYRIVERSRNAFLQTIGIPYQKYRLTSQAVVNQDTR